MSTTTAAKKKTVKALPEPDDSNAAVNWAESVLWAAEHVHEPRISKRKAGSLMRWTHWKYGRENTRDLVVNMCARAVAILDRNTKPSEQADVAKAEQKPIAYYKKLLADALEETDDCEQS